MKGIPTSIEYVYLVRKNDDLTSKYKILLSKDGKTLVKPSEKLRKQIHQTIHKPENRIELQFQYDSENKAGFMYRFELAKHLKEDGIKYFQGFADRFGYWLGQFTKENDFVPVGMLPEQNIMSNLYYFDRGHLSYSLMSAAFPFIYRAAIEGDNIEKDGLAAIILLKEAAITLDNAEWQYKNEFTERKVERLETLAKNTSVLIDIVRKIEPLQQQRIEKQLNT